MLTPRRIIALSVVLAGGFWLAGAALDAWVFLEGSYPHELLQPDLQSTCLRFLAIFVILATGFAWSRHGRQNEAVRQDLAATASNYRRLVDATPDCVMVHAGDRPLFANRRALEFLGFPDLAALGNQSIEDLVHPDDRPVIAARLRSLGEAAGEDEPVEIRVRRRGGETADVLAHGTPIRYDGRDAVLTVFRDITAEVETRRELEASQERLSLALEAARDGVWDWDIHHDRMVYSASWAAMLGLDLQDVATDRSTWESLAHPDDRDRATTLIAAHIRGEIPVYETEVRLRHADGYYIWVLDRGQVVRRSADGEPLRMTGTHRDITARKEAEFALEVRNRMAAIFLTGAGSGTDADEKVLALVCEAVASPTGLLVECEPDGALAVAAARRGSAPDRLATDAPDGVVGRVVRENRAVMSNDKVDLDGSGGEVDGILVVPISTHDQVLGAIAVGGRGSPYGNADLVLLESLAGYLAPILQSYRSNRLAEERLRRAQKMEALGALAGGIAHDFNNILQAILGFTTLALDEAPTGSLLARDLERAIKSTHRGEDLVQRILQFSRQEGQETREMAAAELVQETIDLLRPTLPATIELVADLDPGAGRVLADPARMGQVLLNVATNALHAMEDGGGRLEISLRAVPAGSVSGLAPGLARRELVAIAFRDTGCGMDRETLERLFDPFFTTKAVGKGTGLGLSVVHGIVTGHGGDIRVASQAGQGTDVTIYLPRLVVARPETEPTRVGRASARILFVDDDANIVTVTTGMLRRRGYAVHGCVGGGEALGELAQSADRYDLLVTDASMPVVDGGELVARWRELRPDRPVIVVTGHAREDLPAGVETRGVRIVSKPFDSDELLAAVQDALAGAGPEVDR